MVFKYKLFPFIYLIYLSPLKVTEGLNKKSDLKLLNVSTKPSLRIIIIIYVLCTSLCNF